MMINSKLEAEIEEESRLGTKIGFTWYDENKREFYRKYIQSLLAPVDYPEAKRVANDLAKQYFENFDVLKVPFAGIGGLPGSGKSAFTN